MVSRLIRWLSYLLDNFSQRFEQLGPEVYFSHKYLHTVVTFYTYFLNISSDEMVTMDWNVVIMFLQYLHFV